MLFDYPSQRLQDWLGQKWVTATGRRFQPGEAAWLAGPFGECDVVGDAYVERFAADAGLTVERGADRAGLVDSADAFGLDPASRRRLRREVADFYERTADYRLDAWAEWSPLFRPGGRLVRALYSERMRQLDLPGRPLDVARGFDCDLIRLADPGSGATRCAVWYRRLRTTGQVVYSGVYSTCVLPDGRTCVKVVFPLPRGNATVLLGVSVGDRGELDLVSAGEGFGDPGLYLLLRDGRGRHWARYVRSFRERITVYIDDDETLRADHRLTLWNRPVLHLHYRMTPPVPSAAVRRCA